MLGAWRGKGLPAVVHCMQCMRWRWLWGLVGIVKLAFAEQLAPLLCVCVVLGCGGAMLSVLVIVGVVAWPLNRQAALHCFLVWEMHSCRAWCGLPGRSGFALRMALQAAHTVWKSAQSVCGRRWRAWLCVLYYNRPLRVRNVTDSRVCPVSRHTESVRLPGVNWGCSKSSSSLVCCPLPQHLGGPRCADTNWPTISCQVGRVLRTPSPFPTRQVASHVLRFIVVQYCRCSCMWRCQCRQPSLGGT